MKRLLTILCVLSFANPVSGFDDEITHRGITERAIDASTLGIYLRNNLGLQEGAAAVIKDGKDITWWLKEGSYLEDSPNCRASNHFHNPLLPWEQSYMTDEPWYINKWCSLTGYSTKYSNVTWATGYIMPAPTGTKITPRDQDMGWDDARSYYLEALTAANSGDRESYYAKTFQALGQVLHLLEDMAVPAHVRNDFQSHLAFRGLSLSWPNRWFGNPFEYYVKNHPGLVSGTSDIPSFKAVTDYWDTDGAAEGLAEFTNANYFSDFTIPNNSPTAEHTFPSPKVTSAAFQICVDYAPGSAYLRRYISRKDKGICPELSQARTADHFAAHSLLNAEPIIINNDISTHRLWLDDNVHDTYAKELLPKAVGYSSGLLNYFFRGNIDLIEDTESTSGYIIVNNTEEDMKGTFNIYYDKKSKDEAGNKIIVRTLLWSSTTKSESGLYLDKKSSGSNKSTNISFTYPSDAEEPGKYILVFKGRLGKEEDAVVGKVVSFPDLYIMVIPVNHETREMEEKKYFGTRVTDSNTGSITLTETTALPFTLLDDGAYWDSNYRTWTKKTDEESLGIPLGVGGPQYIAKYWDKENERVRFVPNLSYEKEAYIAFNLKPADSYGLIKEINYVQYIGSPLFGFGMYNANTGWMEYTNKGLYAILSPPVDPKQRLFSLYNGNNFNDTFVETPYLKIYDFNGADLTSSIPKDPEAPHSSIVGAYKPAGESYVKVSIPKIYNTYIKPNPVWKNGMATASSGVEYYSIYPSIEPTYYTGEEKCSTEDNNCGNTNRTDDGSSVNTVFDIPYNFNSYVKVHNNDDGEYYEEIYINGQLVQTSTPSSKLETHYQILAVYKNTALIRETNYVSTGETALPYRYRYDSARIYERYWDFTSKYYIYVNGKRYELSGTTNIKSRYLNVPYWETASGTSPVDYLTYEPIDDITGYHIDRIFINDTFDGSYILVAFDEYSYNNGAGLTHGLRYEQSDSNSSKYILYYGMEQSKIQNADHEATRTGRKLLLFKADGSLKHELQDPIGLDKTIGSVGILN